MRDAAYEQTAQLLEELVERVGRLLDPLAADPSGAAPRSFVRFAHYYQVVEGALGKV